MHEKVIRGAPSHFVFGCNSAVQIPGRGVSPSQGFRTWYLHGLVDFLQLILQHDQNDMENLIFFFSHPPTRFILVTSHVLDIYFEQEQAKYSCTIMSMYVLPDWPLYSDSISPSSGMSIVDNYFLRYGWRHSREEGKQKGNIISSQVIMLVICICNEMLALRILFATHYFL